MLYPRKTETRPVYGQGHNTKQAKIILLANDTNIRYTADDLDSLESIVSSDLGLIFKWFSANKLTVSLEKTNYLIITSPWSPCCDSFSITQNKAKITSLVCEVSWRLPC